MFIRQNDTGKIGIGPAVVVGDGYTVTAALTLSAADSARARLGDDSTVDISGYTWAATASMDGCYDLTLQTGISDTVGPLEIMIEDVSLCLPLYVRFYVLEETVYDAMFAASSLGFSATASITGVLPAATTKPPATPTEREMLQYVYNRLCYGKVTVDATEEICFRDDGVTECYTRSIVDAAGTVTYGEAAAGT